MELFCTEGRRKRKEGVILGEDLRTYLPIHVPVFSFFYWFSSRAQSTRFLRLKKSNRAFFIAANAKLRLRVLIG